MSPDEFIEELEIRLQHAGLSASAITFELSASGTSEDRSGVTVDKIRVTPEKRRQGIATRGLRLLTELADERGVDLYTIPHSLETGILDDGLLKTWYESFGFENAGTRMFPALMRRVHRG